MTKIEWPKIQTREKKQFAAKMKKPKVKKLTKEDLLSGIEEDDAIINRLERKLGLKKVSMVLCDFVLVVY